MDLYSRARCITQTEGLVIKNHTKHAAMSLKYYTIMKILA